MSDALGYRGQLLGWIHSFTGDGVNKFVIDMAGIEALEKLCRLSDDELISVGDMPLKSYDWFKKEILGRTKRIYLSTEEYLADFHPRTGKRNNDRTS